MSTPCATAARAKAAVSSIVCPPGSGSIALTRASNGMSAGITARTASMTSSGNRMRAVTSPPYASVRRLGIGERKLLSR